MYIEKTTVTYFDEAEERQRILEHFEGEKQALLLAMLDAFEAGNWTLLCEQARALPDGMAEFIAEPIYSTARELLHREQRKKAYANGYAPSENAVHWSKQAGLPFAPIAGEFPKYMVLPSSVHGQPVTLVADLGKEQSSAIISAVSKALADRASEDGVKTSLSPEQVSKVVDTLMTNSFFIDLATATSPHVLVVKDRGVAVFHGDRQLTPWGTSVEEATRFGEAYTSALQDCVIHVLAPLFVAPAETGPAQAGGSGDVPQE
jgi:hypothetical protein